MPATAPPDRPTQTTLPSEADLDGDQLVHECALVAARLAATLRDPTATRADVAALLAEVPGGRVDVLAIAACAMIDEGRSPGQLLAWTAQLPRRRRRRYVSTGRRPGRPRLAREHGTERGYQQHRTHRGTPCEPCLAAHSVESRPQACRDEFARLRAQGVDAITAAELTRPSILLSSPARSEHAA